jgi:hypothetical protein
MAQDSPTLCYDSPAPMEDFRVPTVATPAEIRYFDERALAGRIFLPSRDSEHGGPIQPVEWLNQSSVFFPFLEDGARRAVLLNKRYVVVLTVAVPSDELPLLGVMVRLECGTLAMQGVLEIEAPESQRRVLDFVNRPQLFLVLRAGEKRHIIQKHRITRITELED